MFPLIVRTLSINALMKQMAAGANVLEPPPEGFATWDDWRRDIGLPDS
jgi:hypothetical protein